MYGDVIFYLQYNHIDIHWHIHIRILLTGEKKVLSPLPLEIKKTPGREVLEIHLGILHPGETQLEKLKKKWWYSKFKYHNIFYHNNKFKHHNWIPKTASMFKGSIQLDPTSCRVQAKRTISCLLKICKSCTDCAMPQLLIRFLQWR